MPYRPVRGEDGRPSAIRLGDRDRQRHGWHDLRKSYCGRGRNTIVCVRSLTQIVAPHFHVPDLPDITWERDRCWRKTATPLRHILPDYSLAGRIFSHVTLVYAR
jgi:hypothetical protein